MGPDYSGACMWGTVLSVRVQWHRVDGNTWPLNGWHKVNCLWHCLMFTRLSLSPVGAIHLIQACGVVLEHSSPSNSLQDREALWGTTEWVLVILNSQRVIKPLPTTRFLPWLCPWQESRLSLGMMACQVRVAGKAALCGLPQTPATSVSVWWTLWHWWLTQCVYILLVRPVMQQHEGCPVCEKCQMEFPQSSVWTAVLTKSN